MPGRTIFRESAVEAYRRGTEKDVVPRLVSRPVILGLWALLALLVGTVLIAWSVKVPSYAGASGAVLSRAEQGRTAAVLFVSSDDVADLRVGQSVLAQVGSSGKNVEGAVANIEPGLVGPNAARRRYGIEGAAGLITEPSRAVIVRFRNKLPDTAYGGSRLTAKVETGSRRLLAMLTGSARPLGGGS